MKSLKEFYSNADAAKGPYAGFDLKLFQQDGGDMDVLSQDFQTAAEVNEPMYANWGGVYPVMHVTLRSNLGDGPSIDAMVQASNEFVNMMYRRTALEDVNKHNLKQFLNIKDQAAKSL